MSSLLIRRQRRMLRGWIKWIPVVLIPFSVLFIHAWLNIQILRADYVLRELDKEAKTLQNQLRHAGVVQAVQQDPEVLAAQAVELEFIQPKPGQLEVIAYNPANLPDMPESAAFTMARRTTEEADPGHLSFEVMETSPVSIAAEPVPKVAIADPVPAMVDAVEDPPAAPVTSKTEKAPVWLSLDDDAASVFSMPVEEPVSTPVVLELPEDAYQEEILGLEADMGGLDVL